MTKYVVIDDAESGKRRVKKVEETRPGAGLDPRELRAYPEEKRSWIAGLYASWKGAHCEAIDRTERWNVLGRILFFACGFLLPMAVMFSRILWISVTGGANVPSPWSRLSLASAAGVIAASLGVYVWIRRRR